MGAITDRFSSPIWADQDVIPYAARVSVWGRWFICFLSAFELAYRPSLWYPDNMGYLVLLVPLVTLNGLVHHRLLTNRPVTWRWMLLLSAVDIALITAGVAIGGRFNTFIFAIYYPALALFAMVFASVWLSLVWTTVAAAAYSIVTLSVGSGLDRDAGDEKVLVSRLAAMYALMLIVCLITRFERVRRRAAVNRERSMLQERIDVSQRIHDTAAQTAYMVGMGIDRAMGLADGSNRELLAALDATSALSKEAMWELRHPIDAGLIFEDRELGRVLWSHCAMFETITGVPAGLTQSGAEPPLAAETRSRLFSIAHNALTNAFRHARPRRVEVRLDFGARQVRLSVSDDGVGLPGDYAGRGRGINGMRADAEKMGGTLTVESGEGGGGTIITCVIPQETDAPRNRCPVKPMPDAP